MKLLSSILLATATDVAQGQALIPPGAIALASGCDLDGDKPNAYLGGCISDDYCNGLDGHRIFNHFLFTADSVRGFGQTMQLVPECRQINADPTAGFTCGTDTRLVNGTEVVISNVPVTGYGFDTRTIRLLKKAKYESLSTALETHKLCSDEPENYTCDPINHFSDGCSSIAQPINGFTRFTDFFSVEDCEPEVTEHHEDAGWVEEYKIFIGYDDLTFELPGGQKATLDVHKVYEISCKIEKMGEVKTDFEVRKEINNTAVEDVLKTKFFIEKYFGDITDENDRKLIEDVIPMGPNADPNKKVQFKIWSNHPEEYVHLEECELAQEDQDGNIIYQEVFMRDGCVENLWEPFFDNSPTRNSPTINEDWFNMSPLVTGCKTKWHIMCKTASCKRGLETENEDAFNAYCSVSDSCTSRNYLSSFLDDPLSNVHTGRRRRNTEDSSVDEDIVEAVLEHPCFFVDTITTTYCLKDQCWTLADCAKAFPEDFPDYVPSESDDDAKLDEIIETIRDLFEEHIKEITEEDEEPSDEDFMKKIADQAQLVLAATHTIEDVVDQLIASIAKRNA